MNRSGERPVARTTLASQLTPADYMFLAVDQRRVCSAPRTWRVNVCGIHKNEQFCWLQVMLSGVPDYMATVRINARDSAAVAFSALMQWLATAEHPGGIFAVQ